MPHCNKWSAELCTPVCSRWLGEGCLATCSHRGSSPEVLRQPNILTGQIRNLKCCCTNYSQQKNITSDWLKLPACRRDLRLKLNWQQSMWLHSSTYRLNLAASVPSLCICGSIAHIYAKHKMSIAYSSSNPVPVCSGSMTSLPWETLGNQTDGPSSYSTKWLQTLLGPSFH